MIEVLKQALEALYPISHNSTDDYRGQADKAITSLRQAIAELESQEPVAWLLTDKNINSLEVDSIQRLIDRLKHAHYTNLCVRINGQDEWFQADWLKHMVRAIPPQHTEQEQWGASVMMNPDYIAEQQKKTKEIRAMLESQEPVAKYSDIVSDGGLDPRNKFDIPAQREWVGLTEEKIREIWLKGKDHGDDWRDVLALARSFEAELKGLNT